MNESMSIVLDIIIATKCIPADAKFYSCVLLHLDQSISIQDIESSVMIDIRENNPAIRPAATTCQGVAALADGDILIAFDSFRACYL
jgi:hypothetical protein